MKLKATGSKIIVKKIETSTTTPGGIIFLKEDTNIQYFTGIITSLGRGNIYFDKLFPFKVNLGDKVMFAKMEGKEIAKLDGDLYYSIKEFDIIAVIDEEDNLTPIGDILLCKKTEDVTETDSGIIISKTGIRQDKAIVISKGEGVFTGTGKYDDFGIEVGETVLFDSQRGLLIDWNNVLYLALGMSTILAVSPDFDIIQKDNDIFSGEGFSGGIANA